MTPPRTAAALSVHGTCITLIATIIVMAATWALVGPEVDPRRLLGWVLGILTAGAGITLMLHV